MMDATIMALERAMDLRMQAHSVHTSNIANANVPGYKSRNVDFEKRLQEALETGEDNMAPDRKRHEIVQDAVKNVTAQIYEDPLASPNGDGNSVNVDKQMAELSKNMIGWQTSIQLLTKKFSMQKHAISEGTR